MNAPPGDGDEPALIAAARRGDPQAFSELMARHKDALYRFLRRYTGDADDALDLSQETFTACWLKLHSFNVARPFAPWLRRIALNKCRDWSRRRDVRRFFHKAAPIIDVDVASSDQEREVESNNEQQLDALDRAVAALPVSLKEPLLLTAFEGFSHQEAAALLGVSAKAIETRIYRAKQHLRHALAGGEVG